MAVKYTTGSERYNKYTKLISPTNHDGLPLCRASAKLQNIIASETNGENAALKKEGRDWWMISVPQTHLEATPNPSKRRGMLLHGSKSDQ